jgi:Arc/MetJ family transcription regulator
MQVQVYDRVYGGTMRTNIVLDDELLAEAARLSGIKTKKELVNAALRLFIATKKRKNLLDLRGKIEFAPGYDYEGLRSSASQNSSELKTLLV